MSERDPWNTYASLSPEQREQVYKAVKAVAYPSMRKASHIDPQDSKEAVELLKVLEHERKREHVGGALKKFLPDPPNAPPQD